MSDGLIWGSVVVGGIVAAFSPFFIKPILVKAGIVDIPNERSSHVKPTLRGCGIAQLLGVVITVIGLMLAFSWSTDGRIVVSVSIGAIVASITGLNDDIRGASGLSTRLRLFIQICIGTGVSIAAVCIFPRPWWMVGFGLIFIVGYINVVNFMDGINGISGLHGLVVGISYAVIGGLTGHEWLLAIGLMIAIVYVVFLPWNFVPPGAFLGDVGSYLLGALIAGAAVAAVYAGVSWLAMVGPIAIYLADTGVTLVKRLLQHKDIFSGHREHAYQKLTSQGLRHPVASLVVTAFSTATGVLGILSETSNLSVWICLAIILAICGVYMALPYINESTRLVNQEIRR